jgi:two-component system, chemotaxis family, sensor kinase CheA
LAKRLGKAELQVIVHDGGLLAEAERGNALWASLVHLVRNAVDHGLETEEERHSAGKLGPARLELSASAHADRVRLDIVDNGHGIDWQRVRDLAERQGRAHVSRADLVAALFAPGVSTRTAVTTTSGRGVGLAAVHEEVVRMGGKIDVESEPGHGCRWMVEIPAERLGVHLEVPASGARAHHRSFTERLAG